MTIRRNAPHGADQVPETRIAARPGRGQPLTPNAADRPPEPASPARPGDAPLRATPRDISPRPAPPSRPGDAARAQEAGTDVLRALGDRVGKDQFERYFLGQTRLVMRDGSLDVVVSSGFLAQIIERRFGEQLRAVTGARSVSFTVNRDAFLAPARPGAAPASPHTPAGPRPEGSSQPRVLAQARPVLKFTLKDFVVGSANRLAYTAATRLAEDDAPSGPVFVHGVCGVGKTHLVQGVANLFLERRPGAVVRYVTGETFTNDFLSALKQTNSSSNRVEAFRRLYRSADMLVIDDVHFLTNKDHTQQELLHTFDALGLQGARILIASDEHPREIAKLAQKFSEKLVSRFMAGAVVRLDAPDPELRRRLVRHIASRRRLDVDDAAAELIALRSERAPGSLGGFGGSVRELEGLLNQVEAVCRLIPDSSSRDGRVTETLVRRALGLESQAAAALTPTGQPRRPIPVQTIVEFVCRNLQVDVGEFMGRGRHKRVVFARSVAAHLSRELTTQSFPEIARAMGRTNHSTVITAQRRLQRQLETRPDLTLPLDLAPLHPGTALAELVRSFAHQIRTNAR
ncbi:MAG: DnaA/Hda family protein [Phycisphaerales bacterium]